MILTQKPQVDITDGYYPKTDTYVLIRFDFSGEESLGEFRHLYMDTVRSFRTVSELVYRLELLLEETNRPSSDFLCRKEWKDSSCHKSGSGVCRRPRPDFLDKPSFAGADKSGQLFVLHIRYRKNATWQGDIRWLNEKHNFHFRSTLELLMLLEGLCIKYGN